MGLAGSEGGPERLPAQLISSGGGRVHVLRLLRRALDASRRVPRRGHARRCGGAWARRSATPGPTWRPLAARVPHRPLAEPDLRPLGLHGRGDWERAWAPWRGATRWWRCGCVTPRVSLPDVGTVTFQDAETGEQLVLDTSQTSVRSTFENLARARAAEMERRMARHGRPVDGLHRRAPGAGPGALHRAASAHPGGGAAPAAPGGLGRGLRWNTSSRPSCGGSRCPCCCWAPTPWRRAAGRRTPSPTAACTCSAPLSKVALHRLPAPLPTPAAAPRAGPGDGGAGPPGPARGSPRSGRRSCSSWTSPGAWGPATCGPPAWKRRSGRGTSWTPSPGIPGGGGRLLLGRLPGAARHGRPPRRQRAIAELQLGGAPPSGRGWRWPSPPSRLSWSPRPGHHLSRRRGSPRRPGRSGVPARPTPQPGQPRPPRRRSSCCSRTGPTRGVRPWNRRPERGT